MQLPTPGFLLSALLQVSRRFPAALLVSILGALACILLLEEGGGIASEDFFVRSWITCQLGLPFLIALVAFAETRSWHTNKLRLLQLGGIVVLLAAWYWLDPDARDFDWRIVPQYAALLVSAHLAVAFAPYLNARSVRDFWDFNRQLFANFVVGAAFSMILFAGLSLAILATDNLFDLDISERLYAKLFVLLAGVFNTIYFLYHFPQEYGSERGDATASSPEQDAGAYNWVFRSLCKFILIPIVLLYFLILYAYAAKVGLQWSLPKGWISSLVLGFSVAGIFTYLLNFYLAEEDRSVLVKGFKRWFWQVLLPLTGLLLIAIGKRISDYGVTEERYLVAELGIWLVATCLYFLFSRHDNLKFIPISLAVFALIWAFGPWSALEVSKRSQQNILTGILQQSGRFENGKMKPGTTPLLEMEQEQLSSALYYLDKRKAIKPLLPIPVDSNLLEPGKLLEWLHAEPLEQADPDHMNIEAEQPLEPLQIKGFDMAFAVDLNARSRETPGYAADYFLLSEDGKRIEWWQTKSDKKQLVEAFSLETALQKWALMKAKEPTTGYFILPVRDRSFTIYGQHGNICWIADRAFVSLPDSGKKLESSSGWILLKSK